jgi:hypothetical protein
LTLGKAVPLPNFTDRQAERFTDSLSEWFQNPQAVVQRIIYWTSGQPFLTQKLCRLAVEALEPKTSVKFSADHCWLDNLVQQRIIHNWEQQDNPEHLRTIRDRLLHTPQLSSNLLKLYRKILLSEKSNDGSICVEASELYQALLMTGLVIRNEEHLQVQNNIYRSVFDLSWCDRQEQHS